MGLEFQRASVSLGSLVKTQAARPQTQNFDSVGLGSHNKVKYNVTKHSCISNPKNKNQFQLLQFAFELFGFTTVLPEVIQEKKHVFFLWLCEV